MVDVKTILDIVIETEVNAAAGYRNLAGKVDSLKAEIFYKPHQNKVEWNKDVAFYKQLEEKVKISDVPSTFYASMPSKIEKTHVEVFYKGLGDKFTDDVKSIFLDMAKEEEEHAEIFKKIKAGVDSGEDKSFKPEVLDYLKKNAEKGNPLSNVTAPSTILKALEEAAAAEASAVQFYGGMLPYANEGALDTLKRIIHEEKSHETKLKKKIASFKLLLAL